ncbi:hypothetical protein GGH19_005041, partial [Coemansia sp. RSA 1807]
MSVPFQTLLYPTSSYPSIIEYTPPGEKYESEGWEVIFIGGMTIAFTLIGLGVYYKPDT